jgi:hypothetical protein
MAAVLVVGGALKSTLLSFGRTAVTAKRCRKHSGTVVGTQARVLRQQFRLLQGEELIKVYGKGKGALKLLTGVDSHGRFQ